MKVLLCCLPALSAAIEKSDAVQIHTPLHVICFAFSFPLWKFGFCSLSPVFFALFCFKKFINFLKIFTYFFAVLGLCFCMGFFSSFRAKGLFSNCEVQASRCNGVSCCGAWALGCSGFSSCGTWAQLLWGTWDLSRAGIKPCLLHWQVDSLPLSHQGNPVFLNVRRVCFVVGLKFPLSLSSLSSSHATNSLFSQVLLFSSTILLQVYVFLY